MKKLNRNCVLVANRAFGISNSRVDLIHRLTEGGWNVAVASARDAFVGQVEEAGAQFVEIPFSTGGLNLQQDLTALRRLTTLYRSLAPHFVHHFNFRPVVLGGLAAERSTRPIVVSTITGTGYAFESRFAATLAKRGFRRGLRKASAVIFQNPEDRMFFVEQGLAESEISHTIISSGVDVYKFQISKSSFDNPTFVMVSRLLWQKGVHEYVEAAARLKLRYPQAQFLLGGEFIDDSPDSVPSAWLESLEAKGILYIGYVPDMASLLQRCSAFVFPSKYREGVPRVLLEAAASGLPVITTDRPGCREPVIDGETGFLVPGGAIEELVQSMEWIICNCKQAREMGRKGRLLMERQFRKEAIIQETLNLYESLGVSLNIRVAA